VSNKINHNRPGDKVHYQSDKESGVNHRGGSKIIVEKAIQKMLPNPSEGNKIEFEGTGNGRPTKYYKIKYN